MSVCLSVFLSVCLFVYLSQRVLDELLVEVLDFGGCWASRSLLTAMHARGPHLGQILDQNLSSVCPLSTDVLAMRTRAGVLSVQNVSQTKIAHNTLTHLHADALQACIPKCRHIYANTYIPLSSKSFTSSKFVS